jgi:integrase
VSPAQVADWQTWLLTTPRPNGRLLAPTTVADTRSTIRQMFSSAVDLDVIRTNPVDRVKPPKVSRSPGRVLARDEVVRLIAEVDHHRYAGVVAIMFTVGLRVSEVLGLAWCDIDLDAGAAHVRRAVVAGEGGRRFGPTKTEGATGVHHLAEGTVERLRAWKAQQAEERVLAGPWSPRCTRRAPTSVTSPATSGHASPATTSRYVASVGERPLKTARLAAELLDTPMTDPARRSPAAEPSNGFNKPRSRATRRTPRAAHS